MASFNPNNFLNTLVQTITPPPLVQDPEFDGMQHYCYVADLGGCLNIVMQV